MKLTVDKCKELCRDFKLAVDPNVKGCLHLQKNREACNLPSHFLCELVLYKRRHEASANDDRVIFVSASRVSLLERCPRAYAFHYFHGIEPEEEAAWKRIGDAWGVARARIDTDLHVDLDGLRADLKPYERAKVRAAIRLYRLAWGSPSGKLPYGPGDVTCEDEVLFEAHGLRWRGFTDAMSLDRSHIYEWKFAATDYDLLSIARQAAVYLSGYPHARNFTLGVFRKPGQRPGKEESPVAFENRIYGDMCKKPEDWIRHFTIARDQLDVDGVLRDTAAAFKAELSAAEASGWAPHYSSCHDCDYRITCFDHIGMDTERLVQITKKKRSLP